MTETKSSGITQFIKFGVVGISNTLVDWFVFYILINLVFSDQHSLAKAISFIIAVINSYFWNTIWTFKTEYKQVSTKKSAVFSKFVVVSLIGWGVNVYIFNLSASRIDLEIINKDLLPLILASGSAIVVNFFGNKFWTYRR